MLSHRFNQHVFPFYSVRDNVLRMIQYHPCALDPADLSGKMLRPGNRIADDAYTCTRLHRVCQLFQSTLLIPADNVYPSLAALPGKSARKYFITVRIGKTGIGRFGKFKSSFPAIYISLCQFLSSQRWKRCGKQYHRNTVLMQPGQCRVKILIHIRVIGMTFIHDYYLLRKSQVLQHDMLFPQSGHQKPVHGSHHKIRQERHLSAAEKGIHHQSAFSVKICRRNIFLQAHKFRLKFCIAMCQIYAVNSVA